MKYRLIYWHTINLAKRTVMEFESGMVINIKDIIKIDGKEYTIGDVVKDI